ncbi:MAG: hypothetical protein R3181_14840, partial [Rubricoccaceae bacterium]|nr:hypothetical protein [Rubricoccaceae bacterium]
MPTRYALGVLALLLALAVTPVRAQHADAIAAIKDHFVQNQARYGAGASDLAELIVTDAYASRASGATYVYVRQAYRGIPIFNADAPAATAAALPPEPARHAPDPYPCGTAATVRYAVPAPGAT